VFKFLPLHYILGVDVIEYNNLCVKPCLLQCLHVLMNEVDIRKEIVITREAKIVMVLHC
jgi:hypothetical protein